MILLLDTYQLEPKKKTPTKTQHNSTNQKLHLTPQMKTKNFSVLTLSLTILITFLLSNAKQTEPFSHSLNFDHHFNNTITQWFHHSILSQETQLKLNLRTILAAVFSFIASAISSAGGIGGGGLYIPILTIVAGLDLKTATSFSAFMVTGGSIANVFYNFFIRSSKYGGKILIDFDIALLSEPCMLLGVSIGVICNVVFPEWLITILFAFFLAWSTFKTCKNGVVLWRLESEAANRKYEVLNLENESVQNGSTSNGNHVVDKDLGEPLLGTHEERERPVFPWMKLGMLVLVWLSFFILYLFRGNRYGQGIISIKACGVIYWTLSALQVPLAIIFTVWILMRRENCQFQTANHQGMEDSGRSMTQSKLIFPVLALAAGLLGGIFGIGGGMLISPLLFHFGIAPEVTSATSSFMVFFSSFMSAVEYLLLGMSQINAALILSVVCLISSLIGLLVIQKATQKYGRASVIVFSVAIVMALSTVLMTSYGVLDVWRNYKSGGSMGFKSPC